MINWKVYTLICLASIVLFAYAVDLRFFSPAQVVIPPRPIVSHTDSDHFEPDLGNIDSLYHDLPNRKRRIDSLAAGKKSRIERNIAIQVSVEALNTK